MKFRFQAINERATVVRGVLRADDAEHARNLLFGETLFPKSVEEVSEDEKVTWIPRQQVMRRHEERRDGAADGPPRLPVDTRRAPTSLVTGGRGVRGNLGVAPTGEVVFEASGDAAKSRVFRAEDIEMVRVSGFPARWLQLFLVNGELVEFPAGFLLTGAVFKAARAALVRR